MLTFAYRAMLVRLADVAALFSAAVLPLLDVCDLGALAAASRRFRGPATRASRLQWEGFVFVHLAGKMRAFRPLSSAVWKLLRRNIRVYAESRCGDFLLKLDLSLRRNVRDGRDVLFVHTSWRETVGRSVGYSFAFHVRRRNRVVLVCFGGATRPWTAEACMYAYALLAITFAHAERPIVVTKRRGVLPWRVLLRAARTFSGGGARALADAQSCSKSTVVDTLSPAFLVGM